MSPLHGRHAFGRAVQVLLELQLERLADGADDALGQAVGALQDVTSCGRRKPEDAQHRKKQNSAS